MPTMETPTMQRCKWSWTYYSLIMHPYVYARVHACIPTYARCEVAADERARHFADAEGLFHQAYLTTSMLRQSTFFSDSSDGGVGVDGLAEAEGLVVWPKLDVVAHRGDWHGEGQRHADIEEVQRQCLAPNAAQPRVACLTDRRGRPLPRLP